MKKYITFIVFSAFGFVCMGQSTFTEATFREMLDEYKKDSKAFFINRLTEDFRYINPEGKFLHKTDISKTATQKLVTTSDAQKIVNTLQAIERMVEKFLTNAIREPQVYLFEGQGEPGTPYSAAQAQKIFQLARIQAGIKKEVSFHLHATFFCYPCS
jgi:hypothetical protein